MPRLWVAGAGGIPDLRAVVIGQLIPPACSAAIGIILDRRRRKGERRSGGRRRVYLLPWISLQSRIIDFQYPKTPNCGNVIVRYQEHF